MLHAANGPMQLEIEVVLEKGSFTTLYGKSGVGKTSTLRILAGLLNPDAGNIKVDGVHWLDTNNKINLTPQKRKVGMVFQDYALFPNMSVEQNLLFALNDGQDRQMVDELIDLMELREMIGRYPSTLSGGQQQRVALARALVQKPKLLLLDEPLSALDIEMRHKLQVYILNVHKEYGLTTILVSHDIPEILKLSQKVIILENGKVTNVGKPMEVFEQAQLGLYKITGIIQQIEKKENTHLAKVRIGDNTIEIEISNSKAQILKPGDSIRVNMQTLNAQD